MSLYAGGEKSCCMTDAISTTKNKDGCYCLDAVTRVPFDLKGVQCVAGSGFSHSVIIKNFKVFAAGFDEDFSIGSDNCQSHDRFTEIKISDEPISWAACGFYFTLYLTVSGKVILCHAKAKGERITVTLANKAISVFAGYYYGGIIDEEFCIFILDRNDPHKPPQRIHLLFEVVDLVCCNEFLCALTSDGRVYMNKNLSNDPQNFVEVTSLKGMKVEKLSGYYYTCAALTSDGHVYMFGKNNYGQLGNGTTTDNYSSFTEVQFGEEIKDVSCLYHTLFLTKSNKIFGCGLNDYCQLFKKTNETCVLSPILVATIEADKVIACYRHSFILSGTGKLENPAKKLKYIVNRIESLKSTMLTHSQEIKQIKDMSRNLQQRIETNNISINEKLNKISKEDKEQDDKISIIQSQLQVINNNHKQSVESNSKTLHDLEIKQERTNIEQSKKISSITTLCQEQAQSITQLKEKYDDLEEKYKASLEELKQQKQVNEEQNEKINLLIETCKEQAINITRLNEVIQRNEETYSKKIDEMLESNKKQALKNEEFVKSFKYFVDFIEEKLI